MSIQCGHISIQIRLIHHPYVYRRIMSTETLAFKNDTDTYVDTPEPRCDKNEDKVKVTAVTELSKVTVDEIKEAFIEFDIDCDGTITTQVEFY
jgi:hypothetical protein